MPAWEQGWGDNDRGVSYTFGADSVTDFLNKHDLDLICRAHQVCVTAPSGIPCSNQAVKRGGELLPAGLFKRGVEPQSWGADLWIVHKSSRVLLRAGKLGRLVLA